MKFDEIFPCLEKLVLDITHKNKYGAEMWKIENLMNALVFLGSVQSLKLLDFDIQLKECKISRRKRREIFQACLDIIFQKFPKDSKLKIAHFYEG